ncbi:MAG TPA: hypothetical protein DD723_03270 [Candidatus Omnitrophica bacterium]|nr:hypothetical protein [Candidatus Omnitrophota bacterium]
MKEKKRLVIIGKLSFVEDMDVFLSQEDFIIEKADTKEVITKSIQRADMDIIVFDDDSYRLVDDAFHQEVIRLMRASGKNFIVVSSRSIPSAVMEANEWGAADFIVKPYNCREFIARINALVEKKVRVTCVGGGTGLFSLLLGFKNLSDIHLTSIVSMSDDGGSSGKLRSSFGILPPGDIRRSLVALSSAPILMNDVMQYRFQRGNELTGHSFGNLFLTALAEIKGSMAEAVRSLGDILNIQGIVLPITNTQTTLCAEFEDGTIIKGESKIDRAEERAAHLNIARVWHEPETNLGIEAYSAIINADLIIMGPGDLFTSVITNLIVNGFCEAVSNSLARKLYICNLMTKEGETSGFDVRRHVQEMIKYLGEDILDCVLISNTRLSEKAISDYARKNQEPVKLGPWEELHQLTKAKMIVADVGHETQLVRHDSVKLKNEILKIIQNHMRVHPPTPDTTTTHA